MQQVKLEHLTHRGMRCLAIHFLKDHPLIKIVKEISGAAFSVTHRCWYVPEDDTSFDRVFNA